LEKHKIFHENVVKGTKATPAYVKTEPLKRNDIFKLLYHPLDKVKAINGEQFKNLLLTYPAFAKIYSLLWKFRAVLSTKNIEQLDVWLNDAKSLEIKEVNSFTNGLERDIKAIRNAIKYNYSNGLAEGSVNKLKVIKRIMYGRCGFEMLRIKTLRLEKMHFFDPFFAHFSLQNHSMLWLKCLIFSCHHNTSSELYSQHAH